MNYSPKALVNSTWVSDTSSQKWRVIELVIINNYRSLTLFNQDEVKRVDSIFFQNSFQLIIA